MKRVKTIDDYISDSPRRQELERLRAILQSTELEECIKWGGPCYTVGGRNVVGLGAFKSYFGLWFYQGALLADKADVLVNAQEGKTKALRQWRMMSMDDIDEKKIRRYLKEAISLAKEGREIAPDRNKPLAVPAELSKALREDKAAGAAFKMLTQGQKREYAEHIAEAKRADTKERRLEKILPMIKAGKGLNDKYR